VSRKSIYISGLSCRFPESDSPKEFFQNLIDKKDMLTADTRRWKEKIEGVPERFGKIKQSLDVFDNKFFTVHGKQAEKMDPQLRLLLEVSYEALVDAGISLAEISGTRAGVYVGACSSDAHRGWFQSRDEITGYEHTGCAMSMLSNRLSFFYDLNGPSETIDTACSSALVAFDRAVSDLEAGVCDTAIVCGSSMLLWNHGTLAFGKLKMLSPEGMCKSFDQAANGFARAEGIGVVVLTTNRKPTYKPYAKVLATGVNNGGWNATGITFPSGKMQKDLYQKVCQKAKIHPKEIQYIEAHGTGTVAGDGQELEAIYEIYGKENPSLMIGSVKSNMGHCEGASGLAGLIKTLLCMDQEILTPNLHLHNPNEKIRHMFVPREPVYGWQVTKAAISSFGFGGTNAHAIIEKCVEESSEPSNQPELSFLSHRTKEGLYALKKEAHPVYLPNLQNKHKNPYREVLGLPDDPEISDLSGTSDKIYFACSGNGSQWKGMGVELCKKYPLFQEMIRRCGEAIDIDLQAVLNRGCSDALEATTALVAIQIGLFELLKSFGLKEEVFGGFLGHSAGEIVCSYIDKLTTLEKTMKIAFARGTTANQTGNLGMMASVGLSKEKTEQLIAESNLQSQVCVACINSPNNTTISGFKEAVLQVVEQVNKQEVFNRILDTYEKAYHSMLFKPQQENLASILKEKMGVKASKRSERWFSTVAQLDSDTFHFQYHVDAVLQPVDFLSAIQKIPQSAVVAELGPHSVLKNLIRDSRPDLKYVSFMKKGENDVQTFKEGLGKLWKLGIDFELGVPVLARPSLSLRNLLVSWDHSELFPIPKENKFSPSSQQQKVIYNLAEEKDRFLNGHVINGKIILPAMSYLFAMWEIFRKNRNLTLEDPVTYSFSDFEIKQAIQAEKDSKIELVVEHLENQYELKFKDEIIAKVKIDLIEKKWEDSHKFPTESKSIDAFHVYRILTSIGYSYLDDFKVIEAIASDHAANKIHAKLRWEKNNWITFLDGLLHAQLVEPRIQLEWPLVPLRIRSILINPPRFLQNKETSKVAIAERNLGLMTTDGIEIYSMETQELIRNKNEEILTKSYIKEADRILFLGKNEIQDNFLSGYCNLFTNYAIQLCRDLILEEGLQEEGHYKRILESFERYKKAKEVSALDLQYYRNRPECIGLRMLEDCYLKNRTEFLANPLKVISQYLEHGKLYFQDPACSIPDKELILTYLSIVRDNYTKSELNILEIGAGTGGLTRLMVPHIRNDHYIATDITETLSITPDPSLDSIDLVYEKFDLNRADHTIFNRLDVDLIVASNALHTANHLENTLQSIFENLKPGGFAMIHEDHTPFTLGLWGMDSRTWQFEDQREFGLWTSQESWISKFERVGFKVISYSTDPDCLVTLFLIRKPLQIKLDVIPAPSIDHFEGWYPKIKNCTNPTLLTAQSIEQSGVFGFMRTLNKEFDSSIFYALMADEAISEKQLREIEGFGLKTNLFLKGRLATLCSDPIAYPTLRIEGKGDGYHLEFDSIGDLSSGRWVTSPPTQVMRCQVVYSALNFKDVMLATGKVRKNSFLGFAREGKVGLEFSGFNAQGKRYMGIAAKTIGTHVEAYPELIMPIPDGMGYAEAATIPVVYSTVYHALFDRAKIEPGQSILIHAGLGGVGQAALHVCFSLGCKIFVSCHRNKVQQLKALFPMLDDSCIVDSRSADFEKTIMRATKGRGVNIVLNSLADDKLQASLRCVAEEGHFLEIGKYDISKHSALDMNLFNKAITIHGIDIDLLLVQRQNMRKILDQVEIGLRKGIVKPLPIHVFEHTEVEEAFRFMGAAKHSGKVLIHTESLDEKTTSLPFKHLYYHRDEGYIPGEIEKSGICQGGAQNLRQAKAGAEAAQLEEVERCRRAQSLWLSDAGRNRFSNHERYTLITGGLGGFGLVLMQWLFKRGVKKFLITSRKTELNGEQERVIDLLRHEGAEIIISSKNVAKHAEAVDLFEIVQGKIDSVYHLAMSLNDCFFKNMTKEKWDETVGIKAKGAIHLDQLTRNGHVKNFVVFSSVSGKVGFPGQSNYTFGNSVMEEVCRARAEQGYHALSIQWGVMDDAGFVANNYELSQTLKARYATVSMVEAIDFMNDLLANNVNHPNVMFGAIQIKKMRQNTAQVSTDQVLRQIGNVIKIDIRKCGPGDTLEYLGVDSLQVVEIQTILIKALQEVLPLKRISSMKIEELIQLINLRLGSPSSGGKVEQVSEHQKEVGALISKIHDVPKSGQVAYLFLGLGVDFSHLKLPPSPFNLCYVHWENAADVASILSALKDDCEQHGYQKIAFISHSIGYHIAKVIAQQIKLDQFIAISLVNEELLETINYISSRQDISDSVFLGGYKNLAFFVEKHLSVPKLKNQLKIVSDTLELKYLPPNLVLYPSKDTICQKPKGAIEIKGTHQIDSFDMQEIYTHV
jgi:fatty acid synthase